MRERFKDDSSTCVAERRSGFRGNEGKVLVAVAYIANTVARIWWMGIATLSRISFGCSSSRIQMRFAGSVAQSDFIEIITLLAVERAGLCEFHRGRR